MKHVIIIALVFTAIFHPTLSRADDQRCQFYDATRSLTIKQDVQNVMLVARLVNPPRTKVTLSVDNDAGSHQELVWDPAVSDSLQQSVLLENRPRKAGAKKESANWYVTGTVEDHLIHVGSTVLVTTLALPSSAAAPTTASSAPPPTPALSGSPSSPAPSDPSPTTVPPAPSPPSPASAPLPATRSVPPPPRESLSLSFERTVMVVSQLTTKPEPTPDDTTPAPKIVLTCAPATVAMDKLTLDPRRAAAASTARGLLDQAVPQPVEEVMSLLAEIALARAKTGAMALLRSRFVAPICDGLTLKRIDLDRPGDFTDDNDRAFPRTCSLLENMRLEDVLSSGKSMVDAARDDLRLTLAPRIIERMPGVSLGTQDLVKVGLDFASRVIEGESSQVAEVDLLVALLDRLVYADVLSPIPEVVDAVWKARGLAGDKLEELQRTVLDKALPVRFDDYRERRPWHSLEIGGQRSSACRRTHSGSVSSYNPADRRACIDALLKWTNAVPTGKTWLTQLREIFPNVEDILVSELLRGVPQAQVIAISRDITISKIGTSPYCASRVIIAIAKWCSSRERCAAGDIGKIIDAPWTVFEKPDSESIDSVCVANGESVRWFRPLEYKARYIQLATTLVSFLEPVPAGQERARTVSMIRWMFEFVRTQNGGPRQLVEFEEIVGQLIEGDYVRALTQTVVMLKARCQDESGLKNSCSERLTKTIQLLGAVASYAHTYEATKTLDPAEARRARKQALEALIDGATDRSERAGDFIVSLGSNVGLGLMSTLERDSDGTFSDDFGHAFSVRVPLGLSLQWLPEGKQAVGNNFQTSWLGWHAGLTLVDLGQFLSTDQKGAIDDVRWANFVSPGVEAGVLLGSSTQLVTLTFSAAYAPALLEKTNDDGRTSQGAFRVGATVGYYVPFFDFN